MGFTGHIISVGFSPLPLHLHTVNIIVLRFTHHWEVHPSSFPLLTSCEAAPWEGAPLMRTPKQWKWAQIHKAAEALAPLDSSFI